MEYQLKRGDSVVVFCKECQNISFDFKACMHCRQEFGKTVECKILKRNKQIIVSCVGNVKPRLRPSQTTEFEDDLANLPRKERDEVELKQKEEHVLKQDEQELKQDVQEVKQDVQEVKQKDKQEVKQDEQKVKQDEQEVKQKDEQEVKQKDEQEVKQKDEQEVKQKDEQEVKKKDEQEVKQKEQEVKQEVKQKEKQEVKQKDKQEVKKKDEQELKLGNELQKARFEPDKKEKTYLDDIEDIKSHDISTLDEGGYINDKIINFYLKYIYHELMEPDMQTRTLILSTFLFSTLRIKCEDEEKADVAIKKQKEWVLSNVFTKNLDLFAKDFIFIPIHTEGHWYLAVICYLPELIKGKKEKEVIVLDGAESTENMPCLYLFDSLDDNDFVTPAKRHTAHLIIEFFKMHWNFKNPDKKYNWRDIYVRKPKCPQQPNSFDCGVYVLQYVEKFFEIQISLSVDLNGWFSADEVKNKRTEIKTLIKELKKKQLDKLVGHTDSVTEGN